MEMKICQSCGMPLTKEILGTNADGDAHEEFNLLLCWCIGKASSQMDGGHAARFLDKLQKTINTI